MYAFLTYPLDVIKTNRIVGSQLTREAGENLPRELVSVYERGAMQTGFYRGLAPIAFFVGARGVASTLGIRSPLEASSAGSAAWLQSHATVAAATLLMNPLINLSTMKQIFRGSGSESLSYSKLASEAGMARVFTLGITAHLVRNALLWQTISLYDQTSYEPAQLLFGLGALLVSHPFEVARVLIVNGEKSGMFGSTSATLKTLYASEGIAGLYKGFIPRTIH